MKAGTRPEDVAALLSQMREQIRRLEQAKVQAVGHWVLHENDAGELVAHNTISGAVRVVALP